jgi:hypothetical protein
MYNAMAAPIVTTVMLLRELQEKASTPKPQPRHHHRHERLSMTNNRVRYTSHFEHSHRHGRLKLTTRES